MSRTTGDPTGPEDDDDAPYRTLPAPLPRWLRRVIAIHEAVDLVVVGAAVLALVAGSVVWLIGL